MKENLNFELIHQITLEKIVADNETYTSNDVSRAEILVTDVCVCVCVCVCDVQFYIPAYIHGFKKRSV